MSLARERLHLHSYQLRFQRCGRRAPYKSSRISFWNRVCVVGLRSSMARRAGVSEAARAGRREKGTIGMLAVQAHETRRGRAKAYDAGRPWQARRASRAGFCGGDYPMAGWTRGSSRLVSSMGGRLGAGASCLIAWALGCRCRGGSSSRHHGSLPFRSE